MVSKKELEKMLSSIEERIDRRFALMKSEMDVQFESLVTKMDVYGSSIDIFMQKVSTIEKRVDVLELSMASLDIGVITELRATNSELQNRITSLDLASRRNKLIISTNSQDNVPLRYQKIMESISEHPSAYPAPLSSFPIRNKRGDHVGLLLEFSNAKDRKYVTDIVVKSGKPKGVSYRDDLPAVLTPLKNKLLIERRALLSAGTSCYIKTSLKPPFLALVNNQPKKS